jgi:multidrug efflux system membrane fusion protein
VTRSIDLDLSLLPSLIAFTMFLFPSACAKESASAAPPPPPPSVGITTIAPIALAQWDELPGRVQAVDEVELRPRVGGTITDIRLVEGALVRKGDVLFTIDPRPFRAALHRAIAAQAGARARLELAQLEAERSERLIATGAITKSARDASASTAAQAAAELAAAAAQVSLAQLDLEYATVRAPIAGRAGRALVDVGDTVAPGAIVLTTIVSRDPIHVSFVTDEATYLRFAPRLRAGESVPVAIGIGNEDGYPHAGRVDFVANALDARTGTIEMRAVVANADDALVPGLYARVRLSGDTGDAIVVDERAILTDQDRKYVLAVDEKGLAQRKDVGVGRVLDGKRVITRGLAAGDKVIVAGLSRVMPGAPVTVQEEPTNTGAANDAAAPDKTGAANDAAAPTTDTAKAPANASATAPSNTDKASATTPSRSTDAPNTAAKTVAPRAAHTVRRSSVPLADRPTPMAAPPGPAPMAVSPGPAPKVERAPMAVPSPKVERADRPMMPAIPDAGIEGVTP